MSWKVNAVKPELLETSAWLEAVESLTHIPTKEKQRTIIEKLLQKKDVFAVLPRGYGKSVCYGAYHAVYNYFYPEEKATVLVVYPGDSLPAENDESWFETGVKSVVLKPKREMNKKQIDAIKNGEYSVIFAPYKVIRERFWWFIIRDLRNYKLLVIEDVHCVSKRSVLYDKDYPDVCDLRSLMVETPILILSTTATGDLINDVATQFHLRDEMSIVSMSPDRPEIFLGIEKARKDNLEKSLSWYTKLLIEEEGNAPKAIIFARTTSAVAEIYSDLMHNLMEKLKNMSRKNSLVQMYHEVCTKDTKEFILNTFKQPDSRLRCIAATTHLAYDLDAMDVRYVLHWGSAQDPLSYWQEVSQCSRDGKPGKAITYMFPRTTDSKRPIHDSMLDVLYSCTDGKMCLRQKMLAHMALLNSSGIQVPPSQCCSNCAEGEASRTTGGRSGACGDGGGEVLVSQISHLVM